MKERLVQFSPEARDDLLGLYDWIAAAAHPDTAFFYIERIEAYCRGFDVASERGTRREDIRPGLRIIALTQIVAPQPSAADAYSLA